MDHALRSDIQRYRSNQPHSLELRHVASSGCDDDKITGTLEAS